MTQGIVSTPVYLLIGHISFIVEGIKDGHITTGVLNKDVVEDYENRRTTHLMK